MNFRIRVSSVHIPSTPLRLPDFVSEVRAAMESGAGPLALHIDTQLWESNSGYVEIYIYIYYMYM